MAQSKKSARRLVLKGSDNQYAKRDALNAERPAAALPQQGPASPVENPGTGGPTASVVAATAPPVPTPGTPDQTLTPAADVSASAVVRISVQISLGETSSAGAAALAARYGLPLADVIKGARLRALKHFKVMMADGKPLPALTIAEGGLTTLIATKFTGEIAKAIIARFDPLGLGSAASRIKPVIEGLVQYHLQNICDAAP